MKKRYDGRNFNQLRPITATFDFQEFADSSVLLQIGKTKVACAINIQSGVPHFLRGKSTGWLVAEYAMLPASTQTRTQREVSVMKRNGRSVEISRFISRVLRSVVNLGTISDQTIYVDCEIIQADGSTRTACIVAACIALVRAQEKWLKRGVLTNKLIEEFIVAVSVAVQGDGLLLDPDFNEDSSCEADFNIALTSNNKFIEIQGCAEKKPLEWDMLKKIEQLAKDGAQQWFDFFKKMGIKLDVSPKKAPLFSIENRMHLDQ